MLQVSVSAPLAGPCLAYLDAHGHNPTSHRLLILNPTSLLSPDSLANPELFTSKMYFMFSF